MSKANQLEVTDIICPLCQRACSEVAAIKNCSHIFCKECITTKIIKKKLQQCPVCILDMGDNPLEQIKDDGVECQSTGNRFTQRRQDLKEDDNGVRRSSRRRTVLHQSLSLSRMEFLKDSEVENEDEDEEAEEYGNPKRRGNKRKVALRTREIGSSSKISRQQSSYKKRTKVLQEKLPFEGPSNGLKTSDSIRLDAPTDVISISSSTTETSDDERKCIIEEGDLNIPSEEPVLKDKLPFEGPSNGPEASDSTRLDAPLNVASIPSSTAATTTATINVPSEEGDLNVPTNGDERNCIIEEGGLNVPAEEDILNDNLPFEDPLNSLKTPDPAPSDAPPNVTSIPSSTTAATTATSNVPSEEEGDLNVPSEEAVLNDNLPLEDPLNSLETSDSSTVDGNDSYEELLEEAINLWIRTIPIWFTLIPSDKTKESSKNLKLFSFSSLMDKNGDDAPAGSLIRRNAMEKLELQSEHEVEITMGGCLIPPERTLKDLFGSWIRTQPWTLMGDIIETPPDTFTISLTYTTLANLLEALHI